MWKHILKLSASLHMLLVAGGFAYCFTWKGLKENVNHRQRVEIDVCAYFWHRF